MLTKGALRTRLLLLIAIVILINVLANVFYFRLDFTADKRYTLSKATNDILDDLEEPLTVKAYFSEGLSPSIDASRQNFIETLVEYSNRSGGMLNYEVINPNESEELERQAQESRIRPNPQPFREGDKIVTRNVYAGAEFLFGDETEILPVIPPGEPVEYALSSTIKKLSTTNKHRIGLVQGHGEATINSLTQAAAQLSVLYNVEPVNLMDTALVNAYKTLAIVAPTDSFNVLELQNLDRFLATGKGVYIAMNRVDADLSTGMGSEVSTGLEGWLASKGVQVNNAFITDANCGNVSVRQNQGFFNMSRQLPLPFLPSIQSFADHTISRGLESVILPFASSVTNLSSDSSTLFTPLLFTSNKSNEEAPPIMIDINRQWGDQDFPRKRISIGAAIEGASNGNPLKMVVYGDGDFAVNGEGRQQQRQPEDNISLMVNAIDWLSDDTGLNELRTKAITSRPIEKELTDSEKNVFKFANFLLPIFLIMIYGFFRYQMRRRKKMKWLEESYG